MQFLYYWETQGESHDLTVCNNFEIFFHKIAVIGSLSRVYPILFYQRYHLFLDTWPY